MKSGVELIKEERERQISKEGYDAKHDAQHTHYFWNAIWPLLLAELKKEETPKP